MAARATFALKSGEWFRHVRFVIFAPDSHAQPCWVLTPGDLSGVINELREKIRGKMEGAKLLGVFSTGIVTFMLGTLIDTKKITELAEGPFLIFAAALAFLLATLL